MFATDDEIRGAVEEELAWDPRIDDEHVGVAVRHAVVTLRGTVSSYPQKVAACADTRRVIGVTKVDDALEVDLPDASRRSDAQLRARVEAALADNSEVQGSNLQVHADDGWITLTGTVSWHFQRVVADHLAATTLGVYGVTTDIELSPVSRPPDDLKSMIRQAVSRTIRVDRCDISIGVSTDGVVTLHGSSPSAREQEAVIDAAWSAPGVVQVVNDIRIARGTAARHSPHPSIAGEVRHHA